jgi:TorA maturation chaperone TorD
MAAEASLARAGAWADLLAALSNCLREPDDALVASVREGELGEVVAEAGETLDLPADADPPAVESVGALTESYVALFEAMETPYAPPAESPYKPWYGDRRGMMGGPSAEEMSQRYAALDAEFPGSYPPDHVALLLEYGTVLLDAGEIEEFAGHVDAHLDWVPALGLATAGAAADAPFHRWAVGLLDDATVALRSRLGLDPVDEATARTMVAGISKVSPPE